MARKKVRVLRTPADAVDKILDKQRRHARKVEKERRRHEAAMEGLRREEAELKRLEAEARARTSLAPISLNDLPEPALRRVLLSATAHANLLRHAAACARVCAEWRRVVGGSVAYGLGLPRGQREDLGS